MTAEKPRISISFMCIPRPSPAKSPCIRSTAYVIGRKAAIFFIFSGKSISGTVAPDRNSIIK